MLAKQIAHYRIEEKLGEGGMGEVYRARDTKLNRDVALKILPPVFAQDAQRMARFEREAQVLASLNHANIAHIHGLEETDGTKALVLELVEGETLQEQIARGPIPVDEALKIGLQICEGLEAAHEKGIIHRDLKPANIKITPEGQVKILDFGLAKALEAEVPASELSHSPTISHMATQAGVILGTAAYMSPEQARGQPVDKRTDIWAFGCVLFEMLTGKKAFGGDSTGETVSDVLAAVLKSEPDWESLKSKVNWRSREFLRRCLTKAPHDRFHDISDVRIMLLDSSGPVMHEAGSPVQQPWQSRWIIPVAFLSLMLGSLATYFYFALSAETTREEHGQIVRASLILPEEVPLLKFGGSISDGFGSLSISPDGEDVVYVTRSRATSQLCRLSLISGEMKLLSGTEGAILCFFSPDGESIAFSTYDSERRSGALMRVALDQNEEPWLIHDNVNAPYGGAWGVDDSILIPINEIWGLSQVPSVGGISPERVLSSEIWSAWPFILPTGKKAIFSSRSSLSLLSLEDGLVTPLPVGGILQGVGYPRYSPTGHLIFCQFGQLVAAAFDPKSGEIEGKLIPVLDGVATDGFTSAPHYSISNNGTLVYVEGKAETGRLISVDSNNQISPLPIVEGKLINFGLSPDGNKLAVARGSSRGANILIYDLGTGASQSFTETGNNIFPVWSPDGSRIAFSSDRDGYWNIYVKAVDSREAPKRLTSSERIQNSAAWSKDGKLIAFYEFNVLTQQDIGLIDLESGESEIIVNTPGSDTTPTFSPCGKFLAFQSNETGQSQVYVKRLFSDEREVAIATEGGETLWAPDGSVIYYRYPGTGQLKAIPIETEPELKFGNPENVVELPGFLDTWGLSFNVFPDSKQFLTAQRADSASTSKRIEVIVNWFEELRAKVPVE